MSMGIMSMKRRSPLVLVSTTAAVESILGKSRGSETPDVNASATRDPLSKGLVNGNENSHIVLTAGLLLWQGAKSTSVSSSDCLDSTALQDMIRRRQGGKDSGIFEESSTVGVSATVLKSLSLTSGSWVTIKDMFTNWAKPARVMVLDPPEKFVPHLGSPQALRQDYSNTKSFPIYSLVGGNSQQLDPEVAYLSPVLAFNLGIHASWLEFLTSVRDLDPASKPSRHDASGGVSNLRKVATSSCTWCYLVEISPLLAVPQRSFCEITNEQNGALPHITRRAHISQSIYATHMRIGLIRIPTESIVLPPMKRRQAQIDASLQDYFKFDRFLARGDVFSIQLGLSIGSSDSHNADMFASRATLPKVEFLFFKVLALEPSTETVLCANHNHTALVLGGSVASQLPPLSRATYLQKVFLRTPAVQQLTSLLAPCLHPRVLPLDLRLSVLLHGPSGSGKQTAVRLAAEDLGVHVVEHNCYDFVGASEGKTAAALMNAFKTAKRYSPSVLLLRWFEALGKSSSAGVSPGDQQGAISRVISVLKTCIAAHLPSSSLENYNDVGEWLFDGELTDLVKEAKSIPVKFAGIESGTKDGLVLVVATCENAESLTPALRRCFTHEVTIGMPNEDQRLTLLHQYLGVGRYQNNDTRNILGEGVKESLKVIAAQTSGLTPRDLRALAADAGACAITRSARGGQLGQEGTANSSVKHLTDLKSAAVSNPVGELVINVQDVVDENQSLVQVSAKDLQTVLEKVKMRTASAIGTPKVPNVKWEDVGGLEDVKKAILDTVQLPLIHRELFSSGLRQRSGVLLYGPPGTGKTLLAKAVATECALNFLSVKGPELINMYIGESEKNVREIFQKARTARPCVVFFDELDALAPARGASGDSGGVMDRVVSQMLAEIDGVSENSQDLFIIGASNRPDLIDPALLRPGRFDKLLYVGVSSENSYRERVLKALTRKFILHKNVSLKALAQRCPVTYTGADMYALCADAWQQAVKREIPSVEGRKGSNSITSSETIVVKEEDFIQAMGELMPSLSRAELDRYERLRVQFEGK